MNEIDGLKQRVAELEEYKLGELARCAESSEKQSEYEGGLLDHIKELKQELLEIKSDYQCSCGYKYCRICEQRKSIDKILAKRGVQ
jgi:hypothetical protein